MEYGHVSEKRSKLIRVHGGRGDDEFQICTSRHNLKGGREWSQGAPSQNTESETCWGGGLLRADLTQQAEQHVGVQWALVSLVHDDGAVVVQVRLPQRLPEQDAVRHVLDQGFLWRAVLKTNRIAHLKVQTQFAKSQEEQGFPMGMLTIHWLFIDYWLRIYLINLNWSQFKFFYTGKEREIYQ